MIEVQDDGTKRLEVSAATKVDRIRITKSVVVAPHVIAEAGEVFEVPRWMAQQFVGQGQAEFVGAAPSTEPLTTATLDDLTNRDPKPKKVAGK